jgi:hypothetical protein
MGAAVVRSKEDSQRLPRRLGEVPAQAGIPASTDVAACSEQFELRSQASCFREDFAGEEALEGQSSIAAPKKDRSRTGAKRQSPNNAAVYINRTPKNVESWNAALEAFQLSPPAFSPRYFLRRVTGWKATRA